MEETGMVTRFTEATTNRLKLHGLKGLYGTKKHFFMAPHIPATTENYKACVFIKDTYPLLLNFHISPQCIIQWHF